MDAITIITGPRSGAGHLFALMRNVEAVAPRDGLFDDGHANAAQRIADAEGRSAGAAQIAAGAQGNVRDVTRDRRAVTC